MTTPSVALILPDETGLAGVRRALAATAIGFGIHTGGDPAQVIGAAGAGLRLVLVHKSLLQPALGLVNSNVKVGVLTPTTDSALLHQALNHSNIVGLVAWGENGARNWELMYLIRRVLAPSEERPHLGSLLAWGATTVAWRPSTTAEERAIVDRIDTMCKRLGIQRKTAEVVSTAAHELMMNAMYDAPVDAAGRPKYAMDRRASIQLSPEETPVLRFTVDGAWLGLDIIDPFGRLPRSRFFDGVLRGQRAMEGSGAPVIDSSHGGAGLGIHTLYRCGSILRAELTPTLQTHVSWALDRSWTRRQQRSEPRSLYFIPFVGGR